MNGVNISFSVVEDSERQFVLRQRMPEFLNVVRPTIEQTTLIDITDATFEAQVEFDENGLLIPLIVTVVDEDESIIAISTTESIAKRYVNSCGRYYLAMSKNEHKARLWTGDYEIKSGTEA